MAKRKYFNGQRYTLNSGEEVEIVDYVSSYEIIIKFVKTGTMKFTNSDSLGKGSVGKPYEDVQKENLVYLEEAIYSQPHVNYTGRSNEGLVGATKIFIECHKHGEQTIPFRTVKEKRVLCSKCVAKIRKPRKYLVGDKVYKKGKSYTVIKRLKTSVELISDLYQERKPFKVLVCNLKTGNFWCPVEPINDELPCYMGVGQYSSKTHRRAFDRWQNMFQRCYSTKNKQPTYEDCAVHEEWWDFQKYAEWFYKNCPKDLEANRYEVDKDILFKGCKLYSPSTCCVVPSAVNVLFTKRQMYRGAYPIGIYYKKKNRQFCVQCSDGKSQVYLGLYSNIGEAFKVYKSFKESVIKQVTNKYKEVLNPDVYHILMSYEVNFED